MKIDPCKDQLFLCYSYATFPFNFATHFWFVSNEKGKITRYEIIGYYKNKDNTYIFKNRAPPFEGIEILPFVYPLRRKSKVFYKVEGFFAKKMIYFIKKSSEKYPYVSKYFLFGPNSNTYVQWVLNNFPQLNLELPPNAFGKGYKVKS